VPFILLILIFNFIQTLYHQRAIDMAMLNPLVAKSEVSTASTAFHVLPFQYLITLLVVLKYNAPSSKASPSLSTVGSLAFGPRYLSSKLSYAVSAAVADVAALVSDVAAFVSEVAALLSEVAALLSDVAALLALVDALLSDVAALLADVEALDA
jgi:hypothetical protein